jgi:cell division protein FtsZ
MSELEAKPADGKTAASGIAIKVIGVGSAGCNAAEHLAKAGLAGVSFAAVNTHGSVLSQCSVAEKHMLGSKVRRGLGTGGDPEQGRAAAEADLAKLRSLCAGAEIVFLVAGMGGGTGSGAAPVLAQVAKEAGALVLGIVTLPFDWEGSRRQRQAQLGLQHLKQVADAVICVPNQKITRLIDENTGVLETFDIINNLLAQGVRGIWRLLTQPGLIRIDFADLCAVTQGRHSESSLATAEAMGENRTRELVEKLLAHPLVEGERTLAEADAVLLSVMGGPDLTMAEINRVMDQINRHCDHAHLVFGAAIDPAMTNRLTATLLVAGAGSRCLERPQPAVLQNAADAVSASRAPVSGDLGIRIEQPDSAERPPCRIVAPPPALSPEKTEQLYRRQGATSRQRKPGSRWRQGHLPLEVISKGRFDKSEPTVLHGEDLDVPTFVRRGVPLN